MLVISGGNLIFLPSDANYSCLHEIRKVSWPQLKTPKWKNKYPKYGQFWVTVGLHWCNLPCLTPVSDFRLTVEQKFHEISYYLPFLWVPCHRDKLRVDQQNLSASHFPSSRLTSRQALFYSTEANISRLFFFLATFQFHLKTFSLKL